MLGINSSEHYSVARVEVRERVARQNAEQMALRGLAAVEVGRRDNEPER